MKTTKKINIVGYHVAFYDIRERTPRTIRHEVYAMERDTVKAVGLLGLNVADFITGEYKRAGYHVTAVERIKATRTAEIDLGQLWEAAEQNREAPANA